MTGRSIDSTDGLQIVPTGAALGAEVRGMDLSRPLGERVKQWLRDAWAEHLVLLFRDQQMSDPDILAFCQVFGGVQIPAARRYWQRKGHQAGEFGVYEVPEVSPITNLGDDGKPVQDNGGLGSYEVVWHSDNSYVEVPPAGSFLYSIIIPDDGSGATSFNNQYLAYESLPEATRARIDGLVQVHDSSRNSAGKLRPTAKLPTTPEEVEGPTHPLVRVHPVTGRKALYLGRRRDWPSNYIVGLDNAGSEALLDELWAAATAPQLAWTHHWRVGDALLWDNRCTMHYRTEVNPAKPRLLHRAVIKGEPVVGAAA